MTQLSSRGADPLGSIRVSENGRFLTEPDGRPFFWLADTGWAIFARLTREECDEYLADRAAKGFNVIQAVAIGGPFDMLDVPNRYGELALVDMDFDRPNARYFEHIDFVVARAGEYGIRIAMLPVWGASLVGGQQVTGPTFTPPQAESYGRWIAARYRKKGIVWVLGGDTNPLWPRPEQGAAWILGGGASLDLPPNSSSTAFISLVDHRPVYDAMAAGIAAGDGDEPLITFHPNPNSYSAAPEPRTSIYFGDRPWLGLNMLQSSHFAEPASHVFPALRTNFTMLGPENYRYVAQEYLSLPVRPVVDGEPRYEGIPVDICYNPNKPLWTAYDSRNAAYHAVFAGAAGHTFGNLSVHLSYNPAIHPPIPWYPGDIVKHWRDELDSSGARQMRHLKELMLSRPYFCRVPDQSVVLRGQGSGTSYVSATRDEHGSYMFVYVPEGRPIELNTSSLVGPHVRSSWLDPRTGKTGVNQTTAPIGRAARFIPPTQGSDQDWVLILDSVNAQGECVAGRT